MTADDPLLTTQQVADLLGIQPSYVRKLLGRYGVTEERGYRESLVKAIPYVGWRAGQGRRTDLYPPTEQENPDEPIR